MKTFQELFIDARAIGTPYVGVRTFDAPSTINNVKRAIDAEHAKDPEYASSENTPLIVWDAIHGLKGIGDENNDGSKALQNMSRLSGVELAATVDLAIALGVLEFAQENVVAFIHNPQLFWTTDPKVIQGICNLRDLFKANGNMLVPMFGYGDELPTELQQDVLVLDEALPTVDELKAVVVDTFKEAAKVDKYKACAKGPSLELVQAAAQALIGMPLFPSEQATAMSLDKLNGTLDVKQLWSRKRSIVSQRRGMTLCQPEETMVDMYGNRGFASFAKKLMESGRINVILRVDEIQRQFSGNSTDSSGSTGKQLGEFLTWVQDNNVICTLLVGVPGTSKSWAPWCIAGQFNTPLIKYDLAAMEDKHVGEGGKIQRENERVVDAISDKKIWLCATANSLDGLPAEFLSRFQRGGIFFFDVPDDEEKEGIMRLKMKAYKLADQPLPNMESWTGRDIDNCAAKADLLGCSLIEASKYILPLMKSHHKAMEALRESAHDRFLSASQDGIYQYVAKDAPKTIVHTPTVVANGRKIR
jgi:hypothetical protein